jgi:hypothetical protein
VGPGPSACRSAVWEAIRWKLVFAVLGPEDTAGVLGPLRKSFQPAEQPEHAALLSTYQAERNP